MSEIVVTAENFRTEVVESDIPVMLDFWAEWCGPCRMLSPFVSEIAEKYKGKVKVGKVNVDEQGGLAQAFGVESIPLVVVMKNGKVTASSVGYRPLEQLEALLEK